MGSNQDFRSCLRAEQTKTRAEDDANGSARSLPSTHNSDVATVAWRQEERFQSPSTTAADNDIQLPGTEKRGVSEIASEIDARRSLWQPGKVLNGRHKTQKTTTTTVCLRPGTGPRT